MPEKTVGPYKVRTYPVPPTGFDPFSATAADLQRHGLPRRPDAETEAQASLTWMKAMHHYRDRKFTHVVPEFKEHPERVHGPNQRTAEASRGLMDATSSNWSGAVAFVNPAKDPFVWITGEWTVPNAYSPTPGNGETYYLSAWLGIDGDGSPDVLQAGTATQVTGASKAVCYAWMEWYPQFEVEISNFPFAPGDSASLLICSTGPTTASFTFTNLTSLLVTSFKLTAPAGTTLIGNCAEAVLERPGVGGKLAELPRYGENLFNSVSAHTKSAASYTIGNATLISMLADNGTTIISTPSTLDSDSIRMQYTGP